jgi:endo-beta-N-acetylglucosaminidase D
LLRIAPKSAPLPGRIACDGIFTNYTWTEEHLKKSALHSGARASDVYVGVDVFGRGSFGGGQFNVCEALRVIAEHRLSCGLFAPAWTYEEVRTSSFDVFRYRDTRLWSGMMTGENLLKNVQWTRSKSGGQGWKVITIGEQQTNGARYENCMRTSSNLLCV